MRERTLEQKKTLTRQHMNTHNIVKNIALCAMATLSLSACDLLEPSDIVNPNVDEDTFKNTPNAVETWINGTNSTFATTIGEFAELTEILSDNYFNNSSQGSKVFDYPTLLYTDPDVTNLQRAIGTIREMALNGLNNIFQANQGMTQEQEFNLRYIEGYSYLLAGEYFVGLPEENGGDVKDWKDNLNKAIETFDQCLTLAKADTTKAFVNTLLARAYYKLGDKQNAVTYANKALSQSSDFVKQVKFDGKNGVDNSFQGFIYGNPYGTSYQPLPRLDFLDPKYFQTTDQLEQRPICIAKAEEPYLITAEAEIADNNLDKAKQTMSKLLKLVKSRPIQKGINDQLEQRGGGGYKDYPDSSSYKVAASADDSLRAGLVLDRKKPHLIDIPYISGTSVSESMISQCDTQDDLLQLLYLMRQEIFFGEGRRAADLGIRLPLCEVEAANTHADAYTKAQIPSFIPQNQDMDTFTMDKEKMTVVIKYNMNKVIVENKNSEYVAPFFN